MSGKRFLTGSFSLVFIVLFFSGYLANWGGAWRAMDFNSILGSFGRTGVARVFTVVLPETVAFNMPVNEEGEAAAVTDGDRTINVNLPGSITFSDWRGSGGRGARDGFMFALTLFPAVMLAIAAVRVAEFGGALDVSELLLRPLLRPVLGLPGTSGLALVGSFQSADAGAALARKLIDSGSMSNREALIICQFQFSGGGTISNYFSSGAALFPFFPEGTSIMFPFVMICIFKVIGANILRFYLLAFYREDKGATA